MFLMMRQATMDDLNKPTGEAREKARTRRYWAILGGCGLIGGVLGFTMGQGTSKSDGSLTSFLTNDAIATTPAMIFAIAWGIAIPIMMWFFHRTIDEVQERAYLWCGMIGWYAVTTITPIWWILGRAKLLPPADAMIILLISMVVSSIGYLIAKYR
jgi:hypothetical protein